MPIPFNQLQLQPNETTDQYMKRVGILPDPQSVGVSPGASAMQSSTPPIRTPGESIESFTRRIDTGSTGGINTDLQLRPNETTEQYMSRVGVLPDPKSASPVSQPKPSAPIVGTSEPERIKERIKAIKEGLGINEGPVTSALFGPNEQGQLNLARQERNQVNTEMESILAERTALEAEFRKFKSTAGQGVTEGGRMGAISEEGRKYQEQFDALNRRELVLETKLRNRNGIISELMGLQKEDYANAVSQYNASFSQAIQLYSLFDKEEDEFVTNAKANLDVFANAIQSQVEAGQLTADQITPIQQAKIEELEVQAGLPMGSTMAVLQTLKPGEEKLYSGVDDFGNFVYITKGVNGELNVKKAQGAVPQIIKPTGSGGGNGTTPPSETTQKGVNQVLASIGLPLTVATKDGGLTQSALDKVVKAGVPLEVGQGIWQNIISGNSLEEIRVGLAGQFGRDRGYSYLDKFMQALQGGASGGRTL